MVCKVVKRYSLTMHLIMTVMALRLSYIQERRLIAELRGFVDEV